MTFEGGGEGVEDLDKNFLQPKERGKNYAACNRKKYHAKESAQNKFLHVNLLTLFSIVSTGLQDFAFLLSRYTCLKEHMG